MFSPTTLETLHNATFSPGIGPEAYQSWKDAKGAAKYYQVDFPGCYAVPLTDEASRITPKTRGGI